MDVVLRRRFGFERGEITAYEDEHLLDRTEAETRSAILAGEIERPRVGPMRDIVATIQPEQDVIVRADVSETLCVQGAPGTGKTAVGLHRAAYLLYTFRDRLRRGGVLVVGPELGVPVLHLRGAAGARRGRRPAGRPSRSSSAPGSRCAPWSRRAVAALKGDPRMAAGAATARCTPG